MKFEQLSTPVDNRVEKPVVEEKLQEEKGPEGFCIRCGKKIDSNSDIYYSKKCFERWKQYNKPNYQEKFCHICGKPSQTNAYRPVCKDCFPGTSEFINKKKDVVLKDLKYQRNN